MIVFEQAFSFGTSQLLWFVIPKYIVQFLVAAFHRYQYGRRPHPQSGGKTYNRHYLVCLVVVIVGYFLFSVGSDWLELEPSYYAILSVNRRHVEKQLKSTYRQLLQKYHPDKNSAADSETFLRLKKAYDVLNDKLMRRAYDLFGPRVLAQVLAEKSILASEKVFWRTCVESAVIETGVYYGGALAVSLLFSMVFGRASRDVTLLKLYVNFVSVLAQLCFYAGIPWAGCSVSQALLSRLPVFQQIKVLRSITTYSVIALSQFSSLRPGRAPPADRQSILSLFGTLLGQISQRVDKIVEDRGARTDAGAGLH